jgi:hypothetical protein
VAKLINCRVSKAYLEDVLEGLLALKIVDRSFEGAPEDISDHQFIIEFRDAPAFSNVDLEVCGLSAAGITFTGGDRGHIGKSFFVPLSNVLGIS